MDEELDSMRKNDTWEIVERPKDKKCVGNRWVYTIKRLSDGSIERYKARLVAKGYTQVYGEDYTDTFAPVAKLHTVRVLLAVAINKSWGLWQMDVKNAFLQGDLEEEVYMDIPEGIVTRGKDQVCRLKKAIYGLKQSPRAWYQRLSKCLMDTGFSRSSADHSLFIMRGRRGMIVVLIYVDDIIITGDDVEGIESTKGMLKEEFEIKDLGELKYFLGIEMLRTSEGMSLCQRKYTLEILSETGKLGTRPAKTPIEDNYKDDIGKEPYPDVKQYQRLVGKLIYLTITRPDICFAVNQVSKHMQAPTLHHWHMVERILRYLKMNPGKGIWFNNNQRTDLVGYCDADWAGDKDDRKSITGYCTFIGGNLVTWKSKKQKVVSLSSAEAEYRAMKDVTKELVWLKELLGDLGVKCHQPITLHCDNKAALHIASNPVFHERTKHIEVDCHFVREKVQDGTIQTSFVRSEEQLADIFTKATTSQVCEKIHGKIGLRDLHQPILRRSVEQKPMMVIQRDVLKTELPRFDIYVANIPYQISSPLTFKLLFHKTSFRCAVIMYQREFAMRLVAKPGDNLYCRLSVNTQLYARVSHLLKVGKNNFRPPPKVDSSVVRIEPRRPGPQVNKIEWDGFLRVCFIRKNKTLGSIFKQKSVLSMLEKNYKTVQSVLASLQNNGSNGDTGMDHLGYESMGMEDDDNEMDEDDIEMDEGGERSEFKEKVMNVLKEGDFEEKRSSKLSQQEFLYLLSLFNKSGIHFVGVVGVE